MYKSFTLLCILLTSAFGCSDDDSGPRLPYNRDETTVIGSESFWNADGGTAGTGNGGVVIGTPNGTDCGDLGEFCVQPQETCGDDGNADVLLDENGNVLSVICYPTDGVDVENFGGPVEDIGNNVVLVVDGDEDGVDVEGDVVIDGNNVTLYGYGPDVSVIGGDLKLDKNNSLVRGVRILGDLVIAKNNGSIVDCVVEGDLHITGENVTVALCEVWGNITIAANNSVLVSNAFALTPNITAKPKGCHDNVFFTDTDADGAVDPEEITGPFTCD